MSQIPEDLLQSVMQMTGMSRKEAEKALSKSLAEMTNGPIFKSQSPKKKGKRGAKPKYDETNYPHFLPSDNIKKYTIRVALKGTDPQVWRKFECPSNISLRHLTELILQLMGWENEHLNQIKASGNVYYVPCYQHDPDMDWGDHRYQEEYMLSDILREKGKTVSWEYDFGDSWNHDIRLSSIANYALDESHDIIFKSGKGACPPEDCGGIWGYNELLELHAKRKSRKRLTSEEKERLEWYFINKDYDPEYFDDFDCEDICDYFSEEEDDDKAIDASKGIRLINHNLKEIAKEELKKLSPLYDDILSLSFRIRELEPWEDLDDSDVYAIRMQDGSEIHIATMGNGGESFDVQIFDGQKSFQTYLTMVKGDSLPPFEILEAHSWASYKSIMFQDPEDMVMESQQYHMIEMWAKAHDIEISPEHGYPFPQHFRPHRYPTMQMSDTELIRLKEALEAIAWFSQQILDTDELTDLGFKPYRDYATDKGGKVVPLIVKTPEGYKVERTKLPGRITTFTPLTLPESDLQSLRFLQKSGVQFCRLLHIPGYVGSEDDIENGYSSLILLCVDKKDEHVSLSEPCELSTTFEQDVLRQYIKKVQKDGCLPQRLITDDPRTEALLKDFCHQLSIILEFKRTRIPQLTQVCQHLHDNF